MGTDPQPPDLTHSQGMVLIHSWRQNPMTSWLFYPIHTDRHHRHPSVTIIMMRFVRTGPDWLEHHSYELPLLSCPQPSRQGRSLTNYSPLLPLISATVFSLHDSSMLLFSLFHRGPRFGKQVAQIWSQEWIHTLVEFLRSPAEDFNFAPTPISSPSPFLGTPKHM